MTYPIINTSKLFPYQSKYLVSQRAKDTGVHLGTRVILISWPYRVHLRLGETLRARSLICKLLCARAQNREGLHIQSPSSSPPHFQALTKGYPTRSRKTVANQDSFQ